MYKKNFKKFIMTAMLCSMFVSVPAMASGNKFSFEFKDLRNYTYATSWLKEDSNQYYKLVLNKWNGLKKNNLSSTNIFGYKMKDISIGPVVDSYHTTTSYGKQGNSKGRTKYKSKVGRGDEMVLAAKKDSDSSSGDALKISGTVTP